MIFNYKTKWLKWASEDFWTKYILRDDKWGLDIDNETLRDQEIAVKIGKKILKSFNMNNEI